MAASEMAGSTPASPRNAPAANSSESPGRNGITTRPVSTKMTAAMIAVPSTQFCASTAIRPCSLVSQENTSVMPMIESLNQGLACAGAAGMPAHMRWRDAASISMRQTNRFPTDSLGATPASTG